MKAFSQHSLSRRTLLGAGLAAGALSSCPAFADLRIEITGVGANQIPIAIQPFQGASAAPTDPAEVIAADLERSGAFRRISVTQEASTENLEKPEGLAAAGKAGAAVYVVGAVQALSDGRWDVRCLFYDAVSGEQLDSIGVSAGKDLLRMAAHRCADRIYTRLTGEGAMFASQIAYVAQLAKRRYELIICLLYTSPSPRDA